MPTQFRGNIYFDHHIGNVHDGALRIPNTPRMEINFLSGIYTKKGNDLTVLNVLNSELDK